MSKTKKITLVISVVAVMMLLHLPDVIRAVTHYDTIKKYSTAFDVDPALVMAIIYVESKFIPHARSHKGAVGLMQVMPSTFNGIKGELQIKGDSSLLKDPETNIKVGVYYLSKLMGQGITDKVELLAAYNAGKSKMLSWRKRGSQKISVETIPYSETREYVRKVQKVYRWTKRII